MCELSTKLVAWLDSELEERDAAAIEQHLHSCSECRERADRYKNVSGMIRAYADATLAWQEPKRAMPNWAPVLGVAASLVLLLAFVVRARVGRSAGVQSMAAVASAPEAPPQSVTPAPLAAASVATASVGAAAALHSRQARVQVKHTQRKTTESANSRLRNASSDAEWPGGPALEIAIPGDAVFPPGAIPPGFGFVADVNIASDGSAQRMRLHPQLTGFAGGANQ